MKIFVLLIGTLVSIWAIAASPPDLQSELNALNVDQNIPVNSGSEKLYVIQTRAIELSKRLEILAGGGENLTGDGFLSTRSLMLEAQYHVNDRWSFAAAYTNLSNSFNASALNLMNTQGVVPDVDYTLSRIELTAVYNLFYGKIRFSKDSTSYFDQYVGLGVANNQQSSSQSLGPVLEAGFAHWIGESGVLRWGLKDYYVNEQSQLSSGYKSNLFGVLEVGYIFK